MRCMLYTNTMDKNTFESVVIYEYKQIPLWVKKRLVNVALLIEDVVSADTRRSEKLAPNETLLGLYHGIPRNARGEGYGIGDVLPDTITLYREPIAREAKRRAMLENEPFPDALHAMVKETLWHEIGHSLGLTEQAIRTREDKESNTFKLSPQARAS